MSKSFRRPNGKYEDGKRSKFKREKLTVKWVRNTDYDPSMEFLKKEFKH